MSTNSREKVHSGLAIAALIIDGLAIVLLVAGYLFWLYYARRGYFDSFDRPIIPARDEVLIFTGYLLAALLFLLAAGLGIAGLLQPDKHKILAIFGTSIAVPGLFIGVPVVVWLSL